MRHDRTMGEFLLGEVRSLLAVPLERAPEGVILYAARILDATCAELVTRLGKRPSKTVFSNLLKVDAHRLIDHVTRQFAHTVRDMGNDVRHIGRRTRSPEDARIAIVLARELIGWFAGHVKVDHLEEMTVLLHNTIKDDWNAVSAINLVREAHRHRPDIVDRLEGMQDSLLASDFLAALAAEAMIQASRLDAAGALIARAEARHPSSVKLAQLHALVLSRSGRIDEAVARANSLVRLSGENDESLGIASGIYKRRWAKDPGKPGAADALSNAHDIYFKTWDNGDKDNAYLGINAAATALFMGQSALAVSIAHDIVRKMKERDERLAAHGFEPDRSDSADYYDQVTRAEALLIVGESDAARAAYAAAFSAYDYLVDHIRGTRAQAADIARILGIPDIAAPPAPPALIT